MTKSLDAKSDWNWGLYCLLLPCYEMCYDGSFQPTLYQMNAAFKAFSFAHVPQAIVVTSVSPFGATLNMIRAKDQDEFESI